MPAELLAALGLDVRFGGLQVLAGAGLQVDRGEVVAVVGESGSGKSTLFHVIAGFLRPGQGSVRVLGQDVWSLGPTGRDALRRQNVGFLSQEFLLLRHLSAERNVAMPLLLSGVDPGRAVQIGGEALEALGVGERRKVKTARLSRGQRQRVALARSMVDPRPLLLLDEPTSSLDGPTRDAVMGLIRNRAEGGVGVLIATHDRDVAAAVDRRYRLVEGRMVEGEDPLDDEGGDP